MSEFLFPASPALETLHGFATQLGQYRYGLYIIVLLLSLFSYGLYRGRATTPHLRHSTTTNSRLPFHDLQIVALYELLLDHQSEKFKSKVLALLGLVDIASTRTLRGRTFVLVIPPSPLTSEVHTTNASLVIPKRASVGTGVTPELVGAESLITISHIVSRAIGTMLCEVIEKHGGTVGKIITLSRHRDGEKVRRAMRNIRVSFAVVLPTPTRLEVLDRSGWTQVSMEDVVAMIRG